MNNYKLVVNHCNLNKFCEINDFLLVDNALLEKNGINKNIVYATSNNFVGINVYPEDMPLLIERGVWDKLVKINNDLLGFGMRIVIYDGYRPLPVQKMFWNMFYEKYGFYDETLVANPKKRGTHNIRINAVDIFIENIDGSPISLPCNFDDFTGKANIFYDDCSIDAKKNRDLLIGIAKKYGLIVNENEWWHFIDERIIDYGLKGDYSKTNLVPKYEDMVFNYLDDIKSIKDNNIEKNN